MKNFLIIIVLSLSLMPPAKSDDISDFQIDGVSIGDSLLDHYSEYEIKKAMNYPNQYNSDEFKMALFESKSKNYEAMQFHVKKTIINIKSILFRVKQK